MKKISSVTFLAFWPLGPRPNDDDNAGDDDDNDVDDDSACSSLVAVTDLLGDDKLTNLLKARMGGGLSLEGKPEKHVG